MNDPTAKFAIGQVIHHDLFQYRGVIVDVDATYQRDDAWYERMSRTRPPKDQPWYQVLVDESHGETYVAERNLSRDFSKTPVNHPKVDHYFDSFERGRYLPKRNPH